MVDLVYCTANLFFFEIPLLYHINLNSPITCCLSSGDIYLSFGISVSFSTTSKLFFVGLFKTFVILLTILLSIKLPVDSAVFFLNAFFEGF